MSEVVTFPTITHVFMTLFPLLFVIAGILLVRKYRLDLDNESRKEGLLAILGFSLLITGFIVFAIILTVWIKWAVNGEVTIDISKVAGLGK